MALCRQVSASGECIPVVPSCECIPCAAPEICSPPLRFIHQGLKNTQSQKWRRSFAHDRLRRTSRCRIMVKPTRRSRATALQCPPSMQLGLKNNIEKMPPRRDCINASTRCLSTAAGFYGHPWVLLGRAGLLGQAIFSRPFDRLYYFCTKTVFLYTPFRFRIQFFVLKVKNQFPNEVKVPKDIFYKAVHPK